MKKIFSVLAAAVIAFAFTSCGGGADTPEKVAEKFLQHIAKSEFKDAKELATGDAVKTIETLESVASMTAAKLTQFLSAFPSMALNLTSL